MPRYFFHVSAGQDIEDGEGSDLPSLGEAKIEAVKVAAMLLADYEADFQDDHEWSLGLLDEHGRTLFVVRIKMTVPVSQTRH